MIQAAKLYRKTSAKTGKVYWTGRLGGVRVLIFEEREPDGEHTHSLFFADANAANGAATTVPKRDAARQAPVSRTKQQEEGDPWDGGDRIPF